MKLSYRLIIFSFALLCSAVLVCNGWTTNAHRFQESHGSKHGFSVRQYEVFHDVLHPLQHEALPNRDFKRIRAKSALLTRHGRAIVRLGVPRGISEGNREEFTNELKKFSKALTKYRMDSRRGTAAQLEKSYNAVHDSFEMLVAMLPRT